MIPFNVLIKEITVQSSEEEILTSLNIAGLPEYMYMGIVRWIKYGIEPGGFLQALLKNDLFDAVHRATNDNLINLYAWVKWLANAAPSGSHGSEINYIVWREERQQEQVGTANYNIKSAGGGTIESTPWHQEKEKTIPVWDAARSYRLAHGLYNRSKFDVFAAQQGWDPDFTYTVRRYLELRMDCAYNPDCFKEEI